VTRGSWASVGVSMMPEKKVQHLGDGGWMGVRVETNHERRRKGKINKKKTLGEGEGEVAEVLRQGAPTGE